MWVGDCAGRLREGVQALPPSLTSLDLLPGLRAGRGGGGAGGEWRLEMLPRWLGWPGVCNLQRVCAAFDLPGLPCCLTGAVKIRVSAPEEAGPEALGAYLGHCAELAGRLRGGRTGGLELTLEVDDQYGVRGEFYGRVLGAVLPAAAPHVRRLRVLLDSGYYPTGFCTHLAAPGLAFPLLEEIAGQQCQWALHAGRGRGGPGAARRPPALPRRAAVPGVSTRRCDALQLHPRVHGRTLQRRAGRRGAGHGPAAAGRRRGAPDRPAHLIRVQGHRRRHGAGRQERAGCGRAGVGGRGLAHHQRPGHRRRGHGRRGWQERGQRRGQQRGR